MKIKLLVGIVSSLFLFLAISTIAFAQGETPAYTGLKNPFVWTDAATQAKGKGLYQLSCQGCHGAYGNNLAIANLGTKEYAAQIQAKPDIYFWIISEGLPEKACPPLSPLSRKSSAGRY